jgi:hypothetical protein
MNCIALDERLCLGSLSCKKDTLIVMPKKRNEKDHFGEVLKID